MGGTPAFEESLCVWSDQNSKGFLVQRINTKNDTVGGGTNIQIHHLLRDPYQGFTENQVDSVVYYCWNNLPSGTSDAVVGWLVFHEAYSQAQYDHINMGWAVDTLLALNDDITAVADGSWDGFGDGYQGDQNRSSFRLNFWVSEKEGRSIWMAQRYAWKTNADMEWSINYLEEEWRHSVDWLQNSTDPDDHLPWIFTAQTHKDTSSNREYRYPTKAEIMLESVGAVAHGAEGVLYYLFDTDNNSPGSWPDGKAWGMYDSYGDADSIEAMNAGVAEAGERLDEMANLLAEYSYEWVSTSNPGYTHNVTVSGSDTSWTNFGSSGLAWNILEITSDDSTDTAQWVEVCRWKHNTQTNDEIYVICSRDVTVDHEMDVSFQGSWDCGINGYYQGYGSSVPLTIPKGDCVIIRLYTK